MQCGSSTNKLQKKIHSYQMFLQICLDKVKYKINLCQSGFFGQSNVDKLALIFRAAGAQGNSYTAIPVLGKQ